MIGPSAHVKGKQCMTVWYIHVQLDLANYLRLIFTIGSSFDMH